MPDTPEPLASGFVLADRFEIIRMLGRGGFGIVYLAKDRRLQDEAVVKELAPSGTARSETGVLHLESLGAHQAHHLRQRFLEEPKILSKLRLRGLPTVRAAFGENGTAYFATEHIDGAVTLEDLLRQGHRFNADGAMDVFYQALEILEELHAKGFLHRDIKPSNILIAPSGAIALIDFGAAREWHADATVHHTVLFTPGYAPLEQLSPKGRRGPATDVYALCATGYHLLTGTPPPDAAERADGAALTPIRERRPDVDPVIASAIEAGLAVRYEDRPQTMVQLRQMLSEATLDTQPQSLAELDELLVQLKRFAFNQRACPSCNGLLEEAKPLKKGACPVCQRGHVKTRSLNERLCPVCRASLLMRIDNGGPLVFCPICKTGQLARRRASLFSSRHVFHCRECEAHFESTTDGMALTSVRDRSPVETGTTLPFDEWRSISGRSDEVHVCESCHSQFDTLEDGQRKQVIPHEGARTLYPEEWARIALRLDPTAGNAECDNCGAEFDVDGEHISLLSAHDDPFGFTKHFAGRLLTWEDIRWLGVGKESPTPGLVCHQCDTEFDHDGQYLRLVRTENPRLIRHVDEPKTSEDWHRVGRGLPEVNQEQEFLSRIDDSVVWAYASGEIGFDSTGSLLWKGSATRIEDNPTTAELLVKENEITHGTMLRKWRTPLDAVIDARSDGHVLILTLSGQRDMVEFDIEPIELTAALKSGKCVVELGASELAERIRTERGVS